MIESLILIEGESVTGGDLGISLENALQIVIGSAPGFGVILHIAADTPGYLEKALIKFAAIPNVTGVVTLMLRSLK